MKSNQILNSVILFLALVVGSAVVAAPVVTGGDVDIPGRTYYTTVPQTTFETLPALATNGQTIAIGAAALATNGQNIAIGAASHATNATTIGVGAASYATNAMSVAAASALYTTNRFSVGFTGICTNLSTLSTNIFWYYQGIVTNSLVNP